MKAKYFLIQLSIVLVLVVIISSTISVQAETGIIQVPTPISPSGITTKITPTYKWSKVDEASEYKYQLYKGTTLVYEKPLSSSACSESECQVTPTTKLSSDNYKWRVSAFCENVWQPFSAYKTFSILATVGFRSEFETSAESWSSVKGTWKINPVGYYQTSGIVGTTASSMQKNLYKNLTFEVNMKRIGNDVNSIIIRGTPFPVYGQNQWKSGYYFQYSNNQRFRVEKHVNGVTKVLKGNTFYTGIKPNDYNKFKVSASDSTLKFYINDVKVWEGMDSSLTFGKVGIAMYKDTAGTTPLSVDWAKLKTFVTPESLPLQVPVLVLAYYPRDPTNLNYLDPVETGWNNFLITDMRTATQGMIDAGQALIGEATRYRGYKNLNAPQFLEYYTYRKIEYFYKMPRGFPLGGTQYRPNYNRILSNINICDYVDTHGVKEVWIYGYHASVIVPDESKMSSKYGDISNAYPKDEYIPEKYRLPRCMNSYVMYNFTYQPGGGNAIGNNIHNRMHQIENVVFFAENLGYPVNNTNAIKSLFWNDFSVYGDRASLPGYQASCGNTHSPPNTTEGYDYDSLEYRDNNCETWNPNNNLTTYINNNCNQWGCTDIGFYKWFMQNLPGYDNGIFYKGKLMRNWWEAMYDFDHFIDEGRSIYYPIP